MSTCTFKHVSPTHRHYKPCLNEAISDHKMCKKHTQTVRLRQRRQRSKQREKLFEIYGKKCWGCGTTDEVVLTLDHRYADGFIEREGKCCNRKAFVDIMENGYNPRYRVLCFNCQHLAKRGYLYEHEPGAN